MGMGRAAATTRAYIAQGVSCRKMRDQGAVHALTYVGASLRCWIGWGEIFYENHPVQKESRPSRRRKKYDTWQKHSWARFTCSYQLAMDTSLPSGQARPDKSHYSVLMEEYIEEGIQRITARRHGRDDKRHGPTTHCHRTERSCLIVSSKIEIEKVFQLPLLDLRLLCLLYSPISLLLRSPCYSPLQSPVFSATLLLWFSGLHVAVFFVLIFVTIFSTLLSSLVSAFADANANANANADYLLLQSVILEGNLATADILSALSSCEETPLADSF
ncbi:hypothetical protein ACLOJK_041115 [Asimina triloba]